MQQSLRRAILCAHVGIWPPKHSDGMSIVVVLTQPFGEFVILLHSFPGDLLLDVDACCQCKERRRCTMRLSPHYPFGIALPNHPALVRWVLHSWSPAAVRRRHVTGNLRQSCSKCNIIPYVTCLTSVQRLKLLPQPRAVLEQKLIHQRHVEAILCSTIRYGLVSAVLHFEGVSRRRHLNVRAIRREDGF